MAHHRNNDQPADPARLELIGREPQRLHGL
jgi:hypothetical protein